MHENLSFLTKPNPTLYTVEGVELEFFPLSVKTLFQLKPLLPALSNLLSVHLMDSMPSVGSKTLDHSEVPPEGAPRDSIIREESTVDAIKPELYDTKLKAKKAAVTDALNVLMGPQSANLLGSVILESCGQSLRVTAGEDTLAGSPAQFAQALSVPAAVQLLTGVFKANEGAMGKLIPSQIKTGGGN